jgi:hypothetical protein
MIGLHHRSQFKAGGITPLNPLELIFLVTLINCLGDCLVVYEQFIPMTLEKLPFGNDDVLWDTILCVTWVPVIYTKLFK